MRKFVEIPVQVVEGALVIAAEYYLLQSDVLIQRHPVKLVIKIGRKTVPIFFGVKRNRLASDVWSRRGIVLEDQAILL